MLVVAPPGLREVKRAETQQRLAAISYALVRERGFAHVTVDDIAEEAHVSRRTFSNYYACKEEAVAAVILHDAADGLSRWPPVDWTAVGLIDLVRSLVQHQFDAGVLARLASVGNLAVEHRQLVPYVREAQWRLWAMAGDHVLEHDRNADPARQAELDAVLGAVFGVVSGALSRVVPDGTGAALEPERIRGLVEHVLDRLDHGLASTP